MLEPRDASVLLGDLDLASRAQNPRALQSRRQRQDAQPVRIENLLADSPEDRPLLAFGQPMRRRSRIGRGDFGNVGVGERVEQRLEALVPTGRKAEHILAMDLEGSEVCEWLNSIGVTAALLKYRVPRRPELDKHLPPLQDAQRAMSLLRLHAKEWGIDPGRIGVIGFSAGGHLAASLSTATERAYTPMDDTDKLSSLPDFTVLVYPAYLTVKENGDKISPELKISPSTPQTFIVITQDDPVRVENAMHYTLALQAVKVPVELHVYPTGGHGYGLRRTGEVVTTWPDRLSDWLRSRGILKANP